MDIYKLPKKKKQSFSGIYFLLSDGVIVYIGKSLNVINRTTQHNNKIWEEYTYLTCKEKDLSAIEKKYIQIYSPKYNENICYKKIPILENDYVFPELENYQAVLENNQFYLKLKDKYTKLNLVSNKNNYQFEGYKGYLKKFDKYGELEIFQEKYFIIFKNNKFFLEKIN